MIVVFFALAKMGFSHLPFKSIQGGQIASAPLRTNHAVINFWGFCLVLSVFFIFWLPLT